MFTFAGKYLDYFQEKMDNLNADDKHWFAKSFAYGGAMGVLDGLVVTGAMVFLVAGINLIRGKGWTVCPKD